MLLDHRGGGLLVSFDHQSRLVRGGEFHIMLLINVILITGVINSIITVIRVESESETVQRYFTLNVLLNFCYML